MAALGEIPFGLYYGSVDATPLFVMLAGLYAQRTGDYALIRELWPAIERALTWIDERGDLDGDGFVEYARAAETGTGEPGLEGFPRSQCSTPTAAWRKGRSHSSRCRAMSTPPSASPPRARAGWAWPSAPTRCSGKRKTLQVRFEEAFWCEEIGTYALALDGAKRPCKVRTSNAGHALATGIARRDRAHRVADGLMHTRFYSGWGIRTVASGEARYNPMSYHNGSIWPHDNAFIAQGLARYGRKSGIDLIFDGLVRATTYMEHRRIPELYCGFRRRPGRGPTLYPAACSPQAWAAGAPFLMLQAMLGLGVRPRGAQDPPGQSCPCLRPRAGSSCAISRSDDASIDFAVCQDGEAVVGAGAAHQRRSADLPAFRCKRRPSTGI